MTDGLIVVGSMLVRFGERIDSKVTWAFFRKIIGGNTRYLNKKVGITTDA